MSDGGGCPRARATVDLRLVAVVATAPQPGPAVAVVPRSVAVAPRSRGRATAGPYAGKWRRPRGPEAGARWRHSQGWRASRAPRRASSDGVARGARFERHHGRREVHAATITRDILWSGAVRAARVMSSILSCVLDGVLWRLPPPICVISFDYCVLCLTHTLFTLKIVRFYAWTWSSYISLLHA
jgi:hypothetical protein